MNAHTPTRLYDDDVEEAAALETLDDLGARVDGLNFGERAENLVKVAGWLERRKAREEDAIDAYLKFGNGR